MSRSREGGDPKFFLHLDLGVKGAVGLPTGVFTFTSTLGGVVTGPVLPKMSGRGVVAVGVAEVPAAAWTSAEAGTIAAWGTAALADGLGDGDDEEAW